MDITNIDHVVLTVSNLEVSLAFYTSVLGMKKEISAQGRVALKFGMQKINLHEYGSEFNPHANKPTPGSADLCFLTTVPLNDAIAHVKRCDIEIVEGPVKRVGANGTITSFYIRDPDKNLIEIANS